MRKKIIFIDLLLMVIFLLLFILDYLFSLRIKIGNSWHFSFDFLYVGLLLFYYSVIKSILGIILFIKNIIQKNIILISKKILFLFIPSLFLIIFMIYSLLGTLSLVFHYGFELIILIFGCLTLLCYYILNKSLYIKMYNKIIFAIILPISYIIGYYSLLVVYLS